MKVDNFTLSNFWTCPAKYDLRIKQGWTSRRRSAALGFGGALHHGLATWYKTSELSAALTAINDAWEENDNTEDYRTKEKCITVMIDYAKRYPSESFTVVGKENGNALIEVPFCFDTGMYLDCERCGGRVFNPDGRCASCNYPVESIEYGGIFDGLVDFQSQIWILEHKSTSQLGASYFDQFKPNNQITGYIWAAEKASGRKVQGALINAIGIYKSSATRFERQLTSRHAQDIVEWSNNVRLTCNAIKRAERDGYVMNTSACTLYGRCEYHSVHQLTLPVERQKRLEMDYVVQPWEFEKRAGTEVK